MAAADGAHILVSMWEEEVEKMNTIIYLIKTSQIGFSRKM